MTSLIAACGSVRFTSFMPAVPADCSVTTIAFMVFTLVACRFALGSVDAPAVDTMSSMVELLFRFGGVCRVPIKCDGSGSLRLMMPTDRCIAAVHKTVPRPPILAVPFHDGCPPDPTRSCQKDSAGNPDLFGDPRRHRKRTARLGRTVALLAGYGRATRRLPRHRARGLRASGRGAVRDWPWAGRNTCRRSAAPILNTRWVARISASAGPLPRIRKRAADISDGRARSRCLSVQAVVTHPDA